MADLFYKPEQLEQHRQPDNDGAESIRESHVDVGPNVGITDAEKLEKEEEKQKEFWKDSRQTQEPENTKLHDELTPNFITKTIVSSPKKVLASGCLLYFISALLTVGLGLLDSREDNVRNLLIWEDERVESYEKLSLAEQFFG